MTQKISNPVFHLPSDKKDEFCAFCDIVDRYEADPGIKIISISNREYCSYKKFFLH